MLRDWILLLNGDLELNDEIRALLLSGRPILAADGGSNHLHAIQDTERAIIPQIIVGDLDSVARSTLIEYQKHQVEIIKFPADKDQTDLELALDLLLARDVTSTIILGALGGDLDHQLGNLFCLAQEKYRSLNPVVIDPLHIIEVLWSDTKKTFVSTPGSLFSIVPLSDTVTIRSLTGSTWQLSNHTTYRGVGQTLRNQFKESIISAELANGTALAVYRAPFDFSPHLNGGHVS